MMCGNFFFRTFSCSSNQNSWLLSMMFEYQRTPESRIKVVCLRRPPGDSFSNTIERLKKKIIQRSLEMMSLDVSGGIDIMVDGASSSKYVSDFSHLRTINISAFEGEVFWASTFFLFYFLSLFLLFFSCL